MANWDWGSRKVMVGVWELGRGGEKVKIAEC